MPKVTNYNNGIEFYYELHGNPDAEHKIIFVMGLGGTHRGWEPQIDYFKTLPECQVLVFDNRGAGFSHAPPAPYVITDMADDVLFLADHVNFLSFHLVGISMGGMISMHVSLKAPERIRSLGLLVTRVVGGFFAGLPTFTGIMSFGRVALAKTPQSYMYSIVDLLYPSAHLALMDPNNQSFRDVYYGQLSRRAVGIPPQTDQGKRGQLAAVQAHGLNQDQMNTLKSSKFPIFSVVGDCDVLIKPYHSYEMPNQIGADLLIIEGAGHGVSQQCAEIVNDSLYSLFMSSSLPRNTTPEIRRVPCTHIPAPRQQVPIEKPAESVESTEYVL